jgi:hypothetical protein
VVYKSGATVITSASSAIVLGECILARDRWAPSQPSNQLRITTARNTASTAISGISFELSADLNSLASGMFASHSSLDCGSKARGRKSAAGRRAGICLPIFYFREIRACPAASADTGCRRAAGN